jgi:predicted esterase
LVVPKDIPAGERRPVVVCQHGGGGHPEQLVRDQDGAYHAFAARLAEEGFVTFSPQVMFPPPDGWVRQCNSVGLTQYSYVAAMHQRVVDWLRAQPFVEPGRIGLYGLSWGGKTAMRIPLLVDGYALTVVSGDFNEWTWKTTTTDSDYSYVFQPEPYIFEFHLGATFGYAEMAALIAPRPFMVERGHDDPVGTDEQVGLEFAKVRRLYEARLRLPGRCEIEWFVGGHEIHGEGTFRFLRRHLGREPRP